MSWYNPLSWLNDNRLDEEIKAFKNKTDTLTASQQKNQSGEGVTDFINGYGVTSTGSFQQFHNTYINKQHKTKIARLHFYREMSNNAEIAEVIEDAVNEATQVDEDGNIINIKIRDEKIKEKENTVKNIQNEFDELFYKRINIYDNITKWFYRYLVDEKIYVENVINQAKHKDGIIKTKILPIETIDELYDEQGNLEAYIQYLKKGMKKPKSIEEAKKDKDIVVFYPSQISCLSFSYGNETNGFLEKSKIPYNQLKLLETSMIIYRVIRAPERFVFSIDTGAMPRDKAMKFVEKIKRKMNKKETFDPNTGTMTNSVDSTSTLDNFFIPQGENRGSSISTVGGSNMGFDKMDDVYYFQKKLYRSLKYPISRIENKHEGRSADNLFQGNSFDEINRDEMRWSHFLERQQKKFSDFLINIFLLHLDFKGIKKQFGLNKHNISIAFNPPNDYREQMKQKALQVSFDNYTALSNEPEFSKAWLMNKYLGMDEEAIKENAKWKDWDKKIGLVSEDDMGF